MDVFTPSFLCPVMPTLTFSVRCLSPFQKSPRTVSFVLPSFLSFFIYAHHQWLVTHLGSVCNNLVEFGGCEPLVQLTFHEDAEVKRNGMSALVNMAVQGRVESLLL